MLSKTLIVGLALCLVAYGLPYGKDSGVINLTKETFANTVYSTEHIWLIEFYAPWCGHCKSLAPEWEKLAKEMKGIIKVGAVNCDEEKELAGHFGIKGFPTIKFFPSKPTPTKDGKGFEKKPEDYNGARTAAALANFGLSKLPNFVKTTKSASDFETFLSSNSDLAKVVLFTDKEKTTNLYKALSVDYHNRLEFTEVRKSQTELVQQYNVEKFPTLIVIKPDGQQVNFEGKLSHDALFKFLKPHAKPLENQPPPQEKPSKKAPEAAPEFVYDVTKEVVDQATFDGVCKGSKMCIVALLDPTNMDAADHERYVDTLKALQTKHGKLVNFMWMDGVKQSDFVETFRMDSGFPSLFLFHSKKSVMGPYFGSFAEEGISEFVDSISSGTLRKLYPFSKEPKVLAAPKDEL